MRELALQPQSAARTNLHRLFWLRNAMIAFLLGIALLLRGQHVPLSLWPAGVALGGMGAQNLALWMRLRRSGNITEPELLAHLLGDVAMLTVLFYFTGGYSNPLVWMYLLPLTIAAVALRPAFVWLVAWLSVGCYSALVFFHVPLSHLHVHTLAGMGLDIHLAGMWAGFVASAGIIAFFVERIGRTLREYDRLIAETRERALESERMLALGALATAAAHELGTPLTTMAVLTREMGRDPAPSPELAGKLALLKTQISRCKEILSTLTASVGQARSEAASGVALDEFLQSTLERWRDTRPSVEMTCALHGCTPAPHIAADRTLGQALFNLLDNAADASPQSIEVGGTWDSAQLTLEIRDHGAGFTQEAARNAGTPFFTTKKEGGMGLGLYLARTILERFDGRVTLQDHPQGGTVTAILLPLTALALKGKPCP